MKITAKQYAQGLYEATKEKSQKEIDGVLENFVKVLAKNNQLRLKNGVIKKFGEIYNAKNGIIEAQVTSREGIDDELRNSLRNTLRTKYGAKDVALNEKIDASVKGGIIVRVGDEIMDGSISRKLRELKKVLAA